MDGKLYVFRPTGTSLYALGRDVNGNTVEIFGQYGDLGILAICAREYLREKELDDALRAIADFYKTENFLKPILL